MADWQGQPSGQRREWSPVLVPDQINIAAGAVDDQSIQTANGSVRLGVQGVQGLNLDMKPSTSVPSAISPASDHLVTRDTLEIDRQGSPFLHERMQGLSLGAWSCLRFSLCVWLMFESDR